jgi:MFS family permease
VFNGGTFFGADLAGPVGDWLGREQTILIGALIFLLGGGLQIGAQSLSYLYAGRAIAGLGVRFIDPSVSGLLTVISRSVSLS